MPNFNLILSINSNYKDKIFENESISHVHLDSRQSYAGKVAAFAAHKTDITVSIDVVSCAHVILVGF